MCRIFSYSEYILESHSTKEEMEKFLTDNFHISTNEIKNFVQDYIDDNEFLDFSIDCISTDYFYIVFQGVQYFEFSDDYLQFLDDRLSDYHLRVSNIEYYSNYFLIKIKKNPDGKSLPIYIKHGHIPKKSIHKT